MTHSSGMSFQDLAAVNASARLNRLAKFDVTAAENGAAEIVMQWNDDLTQYAGHLHAGMIAALLDTACGFAAATVVGNVTATHFSMNCLRPAVGRRFIAAGTTVRAGRKQVGDAPQYVGAVVHLGARDRRLQFVDQILTRVHSELPTP